MAASAQDPNFDIALQTGAELRERLAGAELRSRERGAVSFMHRLCHVAHGNVALLGDSSGGVDAITGEGLRLCFRQALALADAMEAGDLQLYERAHKKLALRPTRMGQLILLLAGNDMLRERAIRSLPAKPELFLTLFAIHVGHSTPGEVVSAGLLLG